MDTFSAMARGMANRGRELMVFDWDRAARRILESGCVDADAGLCDDWGYTGGNIYREGKPNLDSYTYLASTWAVPELRINGRVEPCYRMQSETPGWDSSTKWPRSALDILAGVTW